MIRAAAVLFAALALVAGCGPKNFSAGNVPFPAEKPVFLDNTGQPANGLPACVEPVRIVLLDFTWCPPCGDSWKALRDASRDIPAGTTRVFRILFDRERMLARDGADEVAPLRPSLPPDAGALPVTTLTALPRAFRERYGFSQVPVLLLMDAEGRVVKRWTGYSSSMAAAIVLEIRRLSSAPPRPVPET